MFESRIDRGVVVAFFMLIAWTGLSGAEDLEALKTRFKEEKSADPSERIETIVSIGEITSEDATKFLVNAMKSEENLGIIATIVRALGKQGSADAVEAIFRRGIPMLQKQIDGIDLFDGIGSYSLQEALSNRLSDEAEAWILKSGLTPAIRKHPLVYKIVLTAVSKFRDPKALDAINAEARKARGTTSQVALLNIYRDKRMPAAEKTAAKLMTARDPEIQVAALEVLLVLNAEKHRSKYLRLLSGKDLRVRILAVDLLAMYRDPKLLRVFEPILKTKEAPLVVAAIAAIVDIATKEVVPVLIAALEYTEGRLRDDLADGLARLTGVDLGPTIGQWESWWAVNKDRADVRKRTLSEFVQIKEDESGGGKTLLYHGLRVTSNKLAFVIDCSESMKETYEYESRHKGAEGDDRKGGTVVRKPGVKGSKSEGNASKMEVAKSELNKVLVRLPDGVLTNVVRFNSVVAPWRQELAKLDEPLRKDARRFIEAAVPEGLTNVFEALEAAFADERVDTIFFLSDGAPTHGKHVEPAEILAAIANMNRFRKVKINTIGFNLKPHEKKLLEMLADQNYGTFVPR